MTTVTTNPKAQTVTQDAVNRSAWTFLQAIIAVAIVKVAVRVGMPDNEILQANAFAIAAAVVSWLTTQYRHHRKTLVLPAEVEEVVVAAENDGWL